VLIGFLFISKVLSIIKAISVISFWSIFKDFLFGIIFLYVGLGLINNEQKSKILIKTLIITFLLNLLIQTIIFFKNEFFINFLSNFLYSKYFENFLIHLNRGRYFVDIFDWCLLPLIIYNLITDNKGSLRKKFFFIFIIILTIFYSIISGFKIHFIISIFSLISMFIFYTSFRKYFLIFFIFLFFMINFVQLSNSNFKLTTLERLNMFEKKNINTIISRLDFWQKSIEMFLSSPLIGIGFGNYYENFYPKKIIHLSLFSHRDKLFEVTAFHPHNVFFAALSETGIIGLLSFTLLICYFLIIDLKYIKDLKSNFKTHRESELKKVLILCFWLLFMFSLIGPDNTIQHIVLFWTLRILIFSSKNISKY